MDMAFFFSSIRFSMDSQATSLLYVVTTQGIDT
jgi:hypothetical protein